MEKPINNKIDALRNEAENQEELMKSLAQIDEEGQLTDDVLDAVSGGAYVDVSMFKIPDTAGFIGSSDDSGPLKL